MQVPRPAHFLRKFGNLNFFTAKKFAFLGKILRAAGENFGDFKRERTGFHTILSPFHLCSKQSKPRSMLTCEGRYVTLPNSTNTKQDGKPLERKRVTKDT